jgi:Flp pilus assembly protein TadG
MLSRYYHRRRRGAAAVELAFVSPVLVVLLLGLWEVGRMIHLQQVLSNSAREGARVAAQGLTINSTGSPTQIHVSTGDPNVKTTIVNYLRQAGLDVTDSEVTVTFAFLDGDTGKTQPYQAAKGQQFRVTVTVPMAKLRWTTVGTFNPASMTAAVTWVSLIDDPFTLDPTIPNW